MPMLWHGRTRAVVFSPDFEPNEGRYEIVVESGERRYTWETEIAVTRPDLGPRERPRCAR